MNIPTAITDPNKRYDFLLLFDVTDGNPNGDPDAGNLPRVDPETMQGIVTDVCLKRKIRNYVDLVNQSAGHTDHDNGIFVRDSGIYLNEKIQEAYKDANGDAKPKDKRRDERPREEAGRLAMCKRFYDVRMFGAVLSTGEKTDPKCGQVRGPMQLTFARSIDPIIPTDVSITRVAITNIKAEKDSEFGRKAQVPYGLYLGKGFYSPMLGKETGVTQEDLKLFWEALLGMFEIDRSASRGYMQMQKTVVFAHESPLGNAPSGKLFARLSVVPKPGIEVARSVEHYDIKLDDTDLPAGVQVFDLIG